MKKVLSYKLQVTGYKLRVTSYNSFLTLLLSCFLTVLSSYGQISTMEEPVSSKREIPVLTINENTHKIMPSLDMAKIEQEDLEDEKNGVIPRFGFKHEVSYNLTNSGEWIELENGDKIWRLSISCPGATSINLLYDRFWLPAGAKFFIYDNDNESYLGAFTSKNNKGKKEDKRGFATGLIRGENITLEYYLPKEAEEMGIISISHVVHGYKLIDSEDRLGRGFGDSWSGHVNINCPAGAEWQKEKDAVVRILTGNGYCSGALVNTTANGDDNRHFVLTANHCLDNNNPILDNWLFYWHYESPVCDNPTNEPPLISTQGAKVVARSVYGDFALLKLDEEPAGQWDVMPYYLGWDHSGNIQTIGSIIHHPKGDIKKIFTLASTIEDDSRTYYYCVGYSTTSLTTHWKFDSQVKEILEGGSSGSPLLNSNHRLIGQHHEVKTMGNQHGVWYEITFGKFSWAWEGYTEEGNCYPDSTNRLKDWLDPLNTNVIVWDGWGGCQKNIRLWHSYPRSAYHAVDSIISKQVIDNGITSYKAGVEIQLLDGFHAKAGAEFTAKIEELQECSGTIAMSPSAPNEEQNGDMSNVSGITNLPSSFFSLFPNPTTGEFTITMNKGINPLVIEIFDVYGRNVMAKFPSNTLEGWQSKTDGVVLNVSHLQDGIYFVKIYSETGDVAVKRLVIMK